MAAAGAHYGFVLSVLCSLVWQDNSSATQPMDKTTEKWRSHNSYPGLYEKDTELLISMPFKVRVLISQYWEDHEVPGIVQNTGPDLLSLHQPWAFLN